jgi:hypothetical protein
LFTLWDSVYGILLARFLGGGMGGGLFTLWD